MPDPAADLITRLRSVWSAPFRGEIWEQPLDLQGGYAVKGPFDIQTVRHLIEPLRAIRDPGVRLVSVRGAVQTTKSLIADVAVPYWVLHDPGDTLWLLEDDQKARLYADRALGLLSSVPEIKSMLQGVHQHDKTKTEIKFQHMKLVICGLNTGNVQSLSWRYVIIDEAWLHPFDGLIRQAMDRTKQYPHTKKILIISQGGVEDDDADVEHKQTDQRELHYACPGCGRLQVFELSRERENGTYAGLSWDKTEETRRSVEAAAATAHHKCFYCDFRIEDTPDMRRKLNDSYCYFPKGTPDEAKKPGLGVPFASSVGFWWPAEASMRVPFGDLVKKYIRAKTSADEQGYRLPLQEFYQKDRGVSWSETLDSTYKAVDIEPYDTESEWAEEAYRPMIIDCQRDLKKFYYSVFAVAMSGEVRELARGTAGSFEELASIQRARNVKDQCVFLDCGYQMTRVLRECVQHGHKGRFADGKTRWCCWTGLKGSGRNIFRHSFKRGGTVITESRIYSEKQFYNVNIGTTGKHPGAPWYEWSNLHCKDLFVARRDREPGVPKFLTLPDDLPPTDHNSYFAQCRAERRVERVLPKLGKTAIYELIKESRPNHYGDICAMLMAFMAIVGIIGQRDSTSPAKP